LAAAKHLLPEDETERAAHFHFARDHDRYVIARANLRRLSGRYLGLPGKEVRFQYGEYGKPGFHSVHASRLTFNLSHAGDYALYGFTSGMAIGVDLEAEDHDIEVERLVHRFFSEREARAVLALPVEQRHAAFFRTWTRKEAFIKAHGQGLGLPLERFSVTVDLASPVRLEAVDWAPGQVNDWSMTSFEVAEGVPAAGVISSLKGSSLKVSFLDVRP